MKPILAILAHEGAQPTIDDFLPKWQAIDAQMICYVPTGDTVRGFSDVRKIGESAHAGEKVYKRFTDTLRDILSECSGDAERMVILIEYDTVPLTPALPDFQPGALICCAMVDMPPLDHNGPKQLCLLSPWVMNAATVARLIPFAEAALGDDPNGENFAGLLDRWIGHVCTEAGVTCRHGRGMLGHVGFKGARELISFHALNWIHGWKSKEQFGKLWT